LYERTLKGESTPELDFYILASDGSVREVQKIIGSSKINTGTKRQPPAKQPFEHLRKQWRGQTKVEGPIAFCNLKIDVPSQQVNSFSESNHNATALACDGDNIINRTKGLPTSPYDIGLLVFWTSYTQIATQRIDSFEISVRIGDRSVLLEATVDNIQGRDVIESSWDYIVISRFYAPLEGMETDKLNLMIIKWTDRKHGLAMRQGLAGMDEKDWVSLPRDWKLVILT